MRQRFTVPGRLMGRNEQEGAARGHWSLAASAKRSEQARVALAARQAGLVPVDGPVEVGFNFIEGRQPNGALRDPDNILGGAAKVVLDALQEAGIIADDGPRTVRNIFARFAYNAEDPHVEVEVMDYDPGGRSVYYPPVSGLD